MKRAAAVALGWTLVAAIVVLSLAPLPQTGPDIPHSDKWGHLIAYVLLMGWFTGLYPRAATTWRFFAGFALLGATLEVLQLVELDNVDDLMPADLSGGMRKRVALARSVALAPRAILYDEPTTGLDPITANTINLLICNLQKRLGVTSIVVTHDIRSAFTVGDRIAFLYEGRILFDGTVEQARAANDPVLSRFLRGGGYG